MSRPKAKVTCWPASPGAWAGRPAVVETRVGEGRAYYLATRLDAAGLERVYAKNAPLSSNPPLAGAGPGVERVVRTSASQSFEFLINHSSADRVLEIAPGGFELLAGRLVDRRVVLGPMGVAIVRRGTGAPPSPEGP